MPECIFIVYFHSHYICHNLTYQRQNHWIVSAWLYIVQESSCFVFFNICNGDKYLVHPGTLSLLLLRWYAILYHRSFPPPPPQRQDHLGWPASQLCYTGIVQRSTSLAVQWPASCWDHPIAVIITFTLMCIGASIMSVRKTFSSSIKCKATCSSYEGGINIPFTKGTRDPISYPVYER